MDKEKLTEEYINSYDLPNWLGRLLMGLGFILISLICMVIVYTFATGVFYLVKIIF